MPMDPLPPEPEILDARLPFLEAQSALAGVPLVGTPDTHSCSWFGTDVLLERGSFALVQRDGPLADLVGDRLKLTWQRKVIYVYCVGTGQPEDVPNDLGITRRAFAALSLLTVDRIDPLVQVVSG